MYKKINIYYAGRYICSTNQAKSCKEAKQNFINRPQWEGIKQDNNFNTLYPVILCTNKITNLDPNKVKARYDKS
jgi:hypothetical protein